ncbi:DUF6154 family protein [Jeotgalibacillus campisalis]|uniref:Cytosolic protein n=1 Tax=Jeotgalibacillus campisalis TaxID=220754 RepID=A0A0C2VNH6_9BACL|nr:DUF6154 family protein [Jeotgalibacillus campisalis]KIL45543.1 hypothetical protein KR50_31250 [Jeotgalibacillus campisalis]
MKLVDEILEMYRGKLRGTQEDLDIIAFTILEQLNRDELLSMVKDMSEEELAYFIRLYIVESLKGKLDQSETASEVNENLYH